MCLFSNNITDYYFVSQGKTTIPGVDDGEECLLTDVRPDRQTDAIVVFRFVYNYFFSLFFICFQRRWFNAIKTIITIQRLVDTKSS